jgi:hypothetical protein
MFNLPSRLARALRPGLRHRVDEAQQRSHAQPDLSFSPQKCHFTLTHGAPTPVRLNFGRISRSKGVEAP